MASLKAIRNRIRSIKSTQKITRAMKMVAAARLRRSQEAALAARPYAQLMRDVLDSVARRVELTRYPLLQRREAIERVEIVAITSDRGLCGGFNGIIEKKVRKLMQDAEAQGQRVTLRTIGRKGNDYFRRREVPIRRNYPGLLSDLKFTAAQEIALDLSRLYLDGEVDQVLLVYNEFVSAVSQKAVEKQLLPIVPPSLQEGACAPVDYLYEPDATSILDELLPRYVTNQMWDALLESLAAENAARMTAMDAATTNASEMINKLTIQMNRTRQAAITSELVEIVSGAEALK